MRAPTAVGSKGGLAARNSLPGECSRPLIAFCLSPHPPPGIHPHEKKKRVEVGFDYVVAAELASSAEEPAKVEDEERAPASEVAKSSGMGAASAGSLEGGSADGVADAATAGVGGDAECGAGGNKANGGAGEPGGTAAAATAAVR